MLKVLRVRIAQLGHPACDYAHLAHFFEYVLGQGQMKDDQIDIASDAELFQESNEDQYCRGVCNISGVKDIRITGFAIPQVKTLKESVWHSEHPLTHFVP